MRKSNYYMSLGMLGALFFVFGLVSWVNSILVPYFKISCELHSEVQGYLANFAFYIAYLVMTFPASALLSRVGFKHGVEYGLWILGTGALLFTPAALVRSYNLFLIGLFTMGTGMAVLQTAANPFVTIIGPIESAARRISVMGICNKFAGILAPIIFAAVVIRPSDKVIIDQVGAGLLEGPAKEAALDQMIRGVIPPYIVLGLFLFVFGYFFFKSSIPEVNPDGSGKDDVSEETESRSILSYPYLVLGAFALFCHLGSQAVSINTIMGYAQSMGVDMLQAKVFPSFTLGCILFGYLLGVLFIPKYLSQQKALIICTVTGLVLSFCVILAGSPVHLFGLDADLSIWFLVLLGIPNSLIYAGIWPLAIHDLGRHTSIGSSVMVMGLCANAIVPLVYAWLVDITGSARVGYWILVPCFIYMIFYAVKGCKIERW
ncbi:MAG: sugar MFS transporter [Bacteroidales bacterium]|nr:sugar MFS transporter [Candidatus Cryptobacteroides onthequi]